MSEQLEDLARRLVVGHKSDGRKVFDETAKAELVALCTAGTSVSRLARQFDVNANQLSRWIREQRGEPRAVGASKPDAFVALPVVTTSPTGVVDDHAAAMAVQVWLPNGVVLELRGVGAQQALELFAMLGRMRCSVSTKD
jgi:transposase